MIHPAGIPNKPALGAADAGMRETSEAAYWESLAKPRLPSFEIPLWRAYWDRLHYRSFRRGPRVRPGMTPANSGPAGLRSHSTDIPRNAAWTLVDRR
jgi:hypothetical protein